MLRSRALQQIASKKRTVYGLGILAIWLVIPAFEITVACLFTEIIDGVCAPWGKFSSFAVMKAMLFVVPFVEFIFPLALMIFCYSRIVYVLRTKVTFSLWCLHSVVSQSINPGFCKVV